MRRLLGALGMAVLVGGLVPGSAPAVPAAASIRCLQISPNTTPGSCTYKSTVFEHETLTAFTLNGWTLDWVSNGTAMHVACTSGSCRNEPGFSFTADAGTTIRVTVTRGVVVVRQVVAAGRSS
jgi:hypothetical protein